MRVGIIQSCYAPWRGYFDFIASVDVFIVYDTVQFSKGSWRNRNRLKTRVGPRWLTVPVRHVSLHQSIAETAVDNTRPWQQTHNDQFRESYCSAPHYARAAAILSEALSDQEARLSSINLRLMRALMRELGIETPLVDAADLAVEGDPTERLIRMVKAVGGTTYLSGPAAKDYLDEVAFMKAGLELKYKTYSYDPYPQLWGDFIGEVSVLDLIANMGAESRGFVRSRSPDIRAAPQLLDG